MIIYVLAFLAALDLTRASKPYSMEYTVDSIFVVMRGGLMPPRNEFTSSTVNDEMGGVDKTSLTSVGKRQMYLLGRSIGEEYENKGLKIEGRDSIRLYSQNEVAYITSARIVGFGFARNKNEFKHNSKNPKIHPKFFSTSLPPDFYTSLPAGLQPIEINLKTIESVDYFFKLANRYTCPNINLKIVAMQIEKLNEVFKYQDSFSAVLKRYGLSNEKVSKLHNTSSLYKAARVYEYLYILKHTSDVPPIDLEEKEVLDLKRCYEAYYTSVVAHTDLLKITTAPLLIDILAGLDSEKESQVKASFYIGNDKFMSSIVNTLGLFQPDCAYLPYTQGSSPPYNCSGFPYHSANIVIESLSLQSDSAKTTDKKYVRIRYNGEYVSLDHASNTPEVPIPFEDFKKALQERVFMDWKERCGLEFRLEQSSSILVWMMLLLLFNVLIIGFFCLGIYITYSSKDNTSTKEQKKRTETGIPPNTNSN